jgi:hypothetical protein
MLAHPTAQVQVESEQKNKDEVCERLRKWIASNAKG